MKMLTALISLVAMAFMIQFAAATNHTVGAPAGGWDEMTDLQTWAASRKFVVGDFLIFTYSSIHDVLEVSKADYDACIPDTAKTVDAGGLTVIQLTTPGKRYYICSATGHCSIGMKLEVDVVASAAPPPPPVMPSPPPQTPVLVPPPPPASATPSVTAPVSAPSPATYVPGTPVWSPTHSPAHSPAHAPKASWPPAQAPSKSPAKAPSKAPAPAPSKAPMSSMAPSESASTPSTVLRPALAPSSATKVNVIAGSTMGFSFAIMMLLTL